MAGADIAARKRAVRDQIWRLLEQEGAAPQGVHGHIPDFAGSDDASAQLARVPAWRAARVVVANPDRAQLQVRARALQEGKRVYMAVPKLAGDKPFFLLDPATLPVSPAQAAKHQVAATIAQTVGPNEIPPVDLFVCGSVAVDRRGARVGKGAGYADTEFGLLTGAGAVAPKTTIVTTVHPLQFVNDDLPEAEHDFRVHLIVIPDAVLDCTPHAL